MRAVVTDLAGGLGIAERPAPVPGPGEVLVRVHGAGVNRADLLQRDGLYPAPPGAPADIPGLELAGEVAALGPGVATLARGDRVMGLVGGGAQAELAVVHERHCVPVPPDLDLAAAGAVPEAFLTAHDALRTVAGLRAGERVLVHAAASGVGTATVQLASALGAEVTGTARTPSKLERLRTLGATHAMSLDARADPGDAARAILDAAGPPDVVVDLVGGSYVTIDVLAVADLGRVVVVGLLAGVQADLPLLPLITKRVRLAGTALRGRDVGEKTAATAAFTAEVVPLLARGAVAPVVEHTLGLGDAPRAYELLAGNATFGKVVLDPRR